MEITKQNSQGHGETWQIWIWACSEGCIYNRWRWLQI